MFDIDMESLKSLPVSNNFIGKQIMTPVSSSPVGPEVLICAHSEDLLQINDILTNDNKYYSQNQAFTYNEHKQDHFKPDLHEVKDGYAHGKYKAEEFE